MKKASKIILAILGGASLVMAIVVAIGIYDIYQATSTKTSLKLYSEIVEQHQQLSSCYSFLPAKINPGAEKNAFYHIPGFLQGAAVICLRQQLPKEEFNQLVQELEASGRTEISDFGDMQEPHCYPKYGIKSAKDASKLPAGFRIFLFESNLAEIKEKWNHHFLGFTAISPENREVIYYAHKF